MAKTNVRSALKAVQSELKAPKGQYNSFGKYKYRSCEDILQAARPLCNSNGLILTVTDTIEMIGNRFYIKATAKVTDEETGESVDTTAYAREDEQKKGMDSSQLTGSCSSYARKYALCGLFAIDDNKDADAIESPQDGAGAKKSTSPNTYTTAPKKPAQNKVERLTAEEEQGLIDQLSALAKQEGITNDDVKMVIQQHYGKNGWKELTPIQKKELSGRFLVIWADVMKKLGSGAA